MARRPWWQNFQVIAYVVAGLAALGTAIGVASKYLTLPQRVEAGEQKNAVQDKLLDRLTYIAEQQTAQNAYWQQQQQAPNQAYQPPTVDQVQYEEWRDPDTGVWYCCDPRTDCNVNENWWVC